MAASPGRPFQSDSWWRTTIQKSELATKTRTAETRIGIQSAAIETMANLLSTAGIPLAGDYLPTGLPRKQSEGRSRPSLSRGRGGTESVATGRAARGIGARRGPAPPPRRRRATVRAPRPGAPGTSRSRRAARRRDALGRGSGANPQLQRLRVQPLEPLDGVHPRGLELLDGVAGRRPDGVPPLDPALGQPPNGLVPGLAGRRRALKAGGALPRRRAGTRCRSRTTPTFSSNQRT